MYLTSSVCDLGAEIDYNIHDHIVISVKSSTGKNLTIYLKMNAALYYKSKSQHK